MANLSIRGLDATALAELKSRAAKEDASVNTLVLRLIEQGLGHRRAKPALPGMTISTLWPEAGARATPLSSSAPPRPSAKPTLEHGPAVLKRDAHFAQIDSLRCGQRLDDFLP